MADTQEKRIQIIFKSDTAHGRYQDALWFTESEYDAVTQEDIDVQKKVRIDNWISTVSTPAPEFSNEDKIATLQSDIDNMTARISELETLKAELA